ncbi:hypothetical protein T459_28076 [Capsicum annuum]|uniref:PI4-kinase N-terminal domain-containing protein n=1 Tax=Capsicum annuum TaxID=4072 RepID=A0A2G2YFV4_CAPAN|nr:hypothetical protein T459_28076 [Capsicum annuum]
MGRSREQAHRSLAAVKRYKLKVRPQLQKPQQNALRCAHDVGLAAESKSGKLVFLRMCFTGLFLENLKDNVFCRRGADSLEPPLPAAAEICSDFDPTVDVEPFTSCSKLVVLYCSLGVTSSITGPSCHEKVSIDYSKQCWQHGSNYTSSSECSIHVEC